MAAVPFSLRAPATEERGFGYLAMAWVATTVALVLAASFVVTGTAAGNEVVVNETIDLGGVLTPASTPADEYPSVLYGGMMWSLVEGRVVPRADDPFSRPIVVAEMLAANTTDHQLRVRESDVSIVLPDGSRHQATRFEQTSATSRFAVEPGQIQQVTVVFKLQSYVDPNPADLTVEFSEPSRIPASMPLIGGEPGLIGSTEFSIDDAVTVIPDTINAPSNLVIEPTAASVQIELGAFRAPNGQRVAAVDFDIRRVSASAAALYLDGEFWEMTTNGQTLAPARVARTGSAAGSDSVQVVFLVDETVTDMVLKVGANTESATVYDISSTQ